MKSRKIEYYIINSKVLPPAKKSEEFYSQLVNNWFEKGYRIQHEGDNSHYFTLTTLDKITRSDGLAFYGVVSKFVKMDDLDFIDSTSGELIEYELPENIQARQQQYEFIFIPKVHRFAFIKTGKIDPSIKKKGAPLKQMINIIKLAFDNGLPKGQSTIVEIEQDPMIFDDIFLNKLLSLEVRVSYTNDDHLNDEHKELMDGLLKDGHIAQIFSRMTPDNSGEIDSSSTLAGGLIGLAKENGNVNALIEYPTGEKRRINTKEYPAVELINVVKEKDDRNNIIFNIVSRFINKYIG